MDDSWKKEVIVVMSVVFPPILVVCSVILLPLSVAYFKYCWRRVTDGSPWSSWQVFLLVLWSSCLVDFLKADNMSNNFILHHKNCRPLSNILEATSDWSWALASQLLLYVMLKELSLKALSKAQLYKLNLRDFSGKWDNFRIHVSIYLYTVDLV